MHWTPRGLSGLVEWTPQGGVGVGAVDATPAAAAAAVDIAEARQFPELASAFYANGPRRYLDVLTELLDGDAATAEHLFGLLLGEPHRRRLLGLDSAPSRPRAKAQALAALHALGLDH